MAQQIPQDTVFELNTFIDMSNQAYHDGPGLSKSDLTLFAKTPLHYKEREKFRETPAMLFGEAVHAAILEPERFTQDYCVLPENMSLRTNAGKDWVKEREGAGQRVLKIEEHDSIIKMQKNVMACETARALLDAEGIVEKSGFWEDPRTGLLCKIRPDKVATDLEIVIDLKTTIDASFQAFTGKVGNFKYHWQGFFYLEGTSQILGKKYTNFLVIVVETAPPYGVAVYRINEEALYIASQELAVLMDEFKDCQERDYWPGYPDQVQTITLPRYYMKRALD